MILELQHKLNSLPDGEVLEAWVTTGYDNAGCQSIADQASRNDLEQGKRESVTVVLNEIVRSNGDDFYDNPNKNSVHGVRPWAQIAMKESRETISWMHQTFIEEETKEAVKDPYEVNIEGGRVVNIHVNIEPFHVDGKCVKETCGFGGVVCTKCTATKKDLHTIAKVIAGFRLDRSMEEMAALAATLERDQDGNIKRYNENQHQLHLGGQEQYCKLDNCLFSVRQ